MPKFHKLIYHKIIRPLRLREEAKILNTLDGETILDIGYFDDSLKKLLYPSKNYFGIDPFPNKKIEKMPLLKFEEFKTAHKFDIVVASNVLEHVKNPIKLLNKIKTLSNKYVCIGVPYEPFYTLSRFFVPEEEHLWTIHPNLLQSIFGKPVIEKYMQFRRSYFAVYCIK